MTKHPAATTPSCARARALGVAKPRKKSTRTCQKCGHGGMGPRTQKCKQCHEKLQKRVYVSKSKRAAARQATQLQQFVVREKPGDSEFEDDVDTASDVSRVWKDGLLAMLEHHPYVVSLKKRCEEAEMNVVARDLRSIEMDAKAKKATAENTMLKNQQCELQQSIKTLEAQNTQLASQNSILKERLNMYAERAIYEARKYAVKNCMAQWNNEYTVNRGYWEHTLNHSKAVLASLKKRNTLAVAQFKKVHETAVKNLNDVKIRYNQLVQTAADSESEDVNVA